MLPSSGPLSWNDVARELVWPPGVPLKSSAPEIYALIGKAPGSVIHFPDDFYGRAFLDIVPDTIRWEDLEGDEVFHGSSRTFTGLALGTSITLKIEAKPECGAAIFQCLKNDLPVGAAAVDAETPLEANFSFEVSNGDRLRFTALRVSPGPVAATVRVLNASLYDHQLTSFKVKLG